MTEKLFHGEETRWEVFEAEQSTLTGIELMCMLRKGQLEGDEMEGLSAAKKFYTLAL